MKYLFRIPENKNKIAITFSPMFFSFIPCCPSYIHSSYYIFVNIIMSSGLEFYSIKKYLNMYYIIRSKKKKKRNCKICTVICPKTLKTEMKEI